MIEKLISGGQTGVDRAALDAAIELNYPIGGWCPKDRLAEDGTLSQSYPLIETPSSDYIQRTEWNVRDSDGTLILAYANLTGGTLATKEFAIQLNKPFLVIDLVKPQPFREIIDWLESNQIIVLNVAGPRESTTPGIYKRAKALLTDLFQSSQV